MQSSVPAGEVNETGSEESVATPGADEAKSITIMVIDDSKTIRRTAETLLRKEGFEVIVATDGFEALSMVADNKPDLIFLDVMMPRLDGYQTCALIKHHRVFRHTPVVMLSSKDGLFDRARGRVVGSDHYITKPFTRDELLAVISQLCNTADKSA
jgi:twitching motility two-component system response regulator PilG